MAKLSLLKLILEYKNEAPQIEKWARTCITRLHKREVSILSTDKWVPIVKQKVNKLEINKNLKM